MDEMISCCGLMCHKCGAFLASINDDHEKRAEVARLWSKQYGADIKPEDINCGGCRSEGGIHFNYCHVCEIRKCVMEKDLANCAHCQDYACETVEKFFRMVPDAKKLLDGIRRKI